MDSPGKIILKLYQIIAYLNLKNISVSISENYFNLSCIGFQSHRAVKFSLNFEFYSPIIASESYYTQDAVGGMTVNLTKGQKEIWPRLATDGKKVSV